MRRDSFISDNLIGAPGDFSVGSIKDIKKILKSAFDVGVARLFSAERRPAPPSAFAGGGKRAPRAIKPAFEPPFARFRFQLTRCLNQQTSNCADKEKKEEKKNKDYGSDARRRTPGD